MIVLNEELWVTPSIQSVYDWADEIIVLEGSVMEYVDLGFTKGFLSNDKTTKILDNFDDPDNKIQIIRKASPWKHKNAMRQATIDASTGDWILVLDGDEVYKKEDLKTMKERAEKCTLECISYPHKNFWNFDQIMKEEKPCIMERFFKRYENMTYPDKNTGQSAFKEDGTMVWHNKEHFDDISVYHYAKLKPKDYTLRKSQYYLVRDYGSTRKHAPQLAEQDYERWGTMTHDWDIKDHPETVKDTEAYKYFIENKELPFNHKS